MGIFDDEINRIAADGARAEAADRVNEAAQLADARTALPEVNQVLRDCAAYLNRSVPARSVPFGPPRKLFRKQLQSPEGFVFVQHTLYMSIEEHYVLLTTGGEVWSSRYRVGLRHPSGPGLTYGIEPLTPEAIASRSVLLNDAPTAIGSSQGRAMAIRSGSHGDGPTFTPLAKYLATVAQLVVERGNN